VPINFPQPPCGTQSMLTTKLLQLAAKYIKNDLNINNVLLFGNADPSYLLR
jgi:hypothetical protein